jgi:alpha-L-rhamnosidase
MKRTLYLIVLLLCTGAEVFSQTKIQGLLTESSVTPLGIDEKTPKFTWQMSAMDRGVLQTAYHITVTDPKGAVAWDTKKVASDISLNIPYAGSALQPTTHYTWKVTVWDQKGTESSATSWFETGLMNPNANLAAWNGATWIGGATSDLVLNAHYLSIYKLNYTQAIAAGSTKASFVIGANDSRLMDKNKNTYGIQSKKDESYIRLELDITGVDGSPEGKAKFNVYRAGYSDKDNANVPLGSFNILPALINTSNKNSDHNFQISCTFGRISISIDGNSAFDGAVAPQGQGGRGGQGGPGGGGGVGVTLNPLGNGGNFTTYGMLCDMGFAVPAGQKASFSNVAVSYLRAPSNTVFMEDLTKPVYDGIFAGSNGLTVAQAKFNIDGGTQGVFIAKDPSHNSTPIVRTQFTTGTKNIDHARLYVTARGVYEMFLNGNRVGNDYFNPGFTQYNVTHMYQTYDVTSMLNKGNNALGAMLGEGWWSGLLSFGSIWNHFGDRQSLLAKLVITYDDGTSDVVTTNDQSWKYYNNGPILYSSLDLGEIYDARKEAAISGWSTASYNDSAWKKASKVALEGTAYLDTTPSFDYSRMQLIGQVGNNAGVYKTLTAQSVKEVRPGVFVYNMGQNMVGVPKIAFANGKAGNKVTLRVAEMLYPNLPESGNNVGMVMLENYRAALCIDHYTMKDGQQTFQPKFTSRGYQYIEITGIEAALPLAAVQGVVISSVLQLTADYETSNPRINKLWSNLVWSNVDNFLSIPTDCPQRNERMGWSGDINVFAHTSTYISNSDQFLKRHMYAMRDVQTPAGRFTDIAPVGGGFGGVLWGSAGIVVAWQAYLQYNNITLLQEHYDAMVKYIDYLSTTINKDTGISSDQALGDWLGPQNNKLGQAFLVTAYHIYDLSIMTEVAKVLGKTSDAERFTKLHAERKAFFNSKFVNADHKTLGLIGGGRGGFGGGGGGTPPPAPEYKLADTQTSYAVGLALNLFNDEHKPFMAANLAETVKRKNLDDTNAERGEYSLMTGFIGTAWINKALSDNGYNDISYKLLQQSQYPSWLYAIDQGATSIWERLNGYTVENGFGGNNSMNSFNHYSFGAVGQWMMAYSLGIQRDEKTPGFKHFILQPQNDPTGQMTYAKGYYDAMYGRISSSWKVDKGVLTYAATVPANTTATLYLPAKSEKVVTEGGKKISKKTAGIKFVKFENGKAVYELSSGSYTFTASI